MERFRPRKAILARGNDRLAKLTTSARGEDNPVYAHQDPPLPEIHSRSQTPDVVLSEDQQNVLFQALMGPPRQDPLLSQFQEQPTSVPSQPPKPPSRLQKLMPLLHLLCVWALLAYFVFSREPQVFGAGWSWSRWARLGTDGWGIEAVPFFYAFLTLQILLHSLRIFSGIDAPQPHPLLSLALPHLPSPFPSLIMNALSYFKMAGFFLDDLAGLIVGVGVCVLVGGFMDR